MATMDRFRFGMRDALANGLPLTDALGQGISAAAAADEAGRKKGFQRSITDAIGRGLTARQAIGDALGAGYNTADYGVRGMRKGVRKAAPATGGAKRPRNPNWTENRRDYARVHTPEAMERWVKKGGWDNLKHFEEETGASFPEIKGQWFSVHGNRVFKKGSDDY